MDLFLINGHDGVSISDMIDWDIKLSNSDLSEEVGVNNLLGVGYELPSLETEDEPGSLWPQTYSANSNSSFELDLLGVEGAASMMVEPSSVMPFVSRRPPPPAAAPASSPEHSTDSKLDLPEAPVSPPPIKIDQVFQLDYKDEEGIKIEVVDKEDSEGDYLAASESVDLEECVSLETEENAQPQSLMTLPVEIINITSARVVESARKVKKRQVTPSGEFEVKTFPKPAYSYSCLIAMALKNSPTGSLPVSEIYSFMCHHFPYFKTAPSGWKNSVRHNLSLNKCFEKIEKPHFNGGSHRKGCLWGLNPAKKTKMDEEVAKWSKKDPFSIKSAMVYPEYLELLERGEMKDEAAFLVPEAEEDQEDIKEGDEFGIDVEDDRISPIDDDSDDEISRVPPSLQPFEPKFANISRYTIAECENVSNTSRNVKKEIVDEYEFLDVEGEEVDNDSQSDGCVADESTRAFLGLDDSTPIYAVDPSDENVLIELPLIKKPRVQANYIYGPAVNMKRHNISGFRSLKIKSP